MDHKPDLSFIHFCSLVALVGTLTTLGNTLLPHFMTPATTPEARALLVNDTLYMARQWIMLLHAPATLIPILGLTLALWQRAPGWCALGFLWTLIEKALELIGQTIIIFTVNLDWRSQLSSLDPAPDLQTRIDTLLGAWDDVFVVLWFSGGLAALSFAYVLGKAPAINRSKGDMLLALLMLGGACGAPLLFVADYGDQQWAGAVVTWLYPPLMTALRFGIAIWLWQYATVNDRHFTGWRCSPER